MGTPPNCSQCGKLLPEDWAKDDADDGEPVCPECAARHIKSRSQRRRVMELLLEMYEDRPVIDPEAKNPPPRPSDK